MRLFNTRYVTSAMLAATLALPVAAWAQTAKPAAAEPAGGQQARVEQRIADMYATLKITDQQDAQWNVFAQVMLDNAQAMDALLTKDAASLETQTAEQSMQRYASIADLHAQNVQKLSAAFGTLYAQLTPEQQKAADEMFRAKDLARAQKTAG